MRIHIENSGGSLDCTIKYSARAKNMRLKIAKESGVVISMPKILFAERFAKRFVIKNWDWIQKEILKLKLNPSFAVKNVPGEYLKYKEIARAKIEKKVTDWNQIYKYEYRKVSIKRTSNIFLNCIPHH